VGFAQLLYVSRSRLSIDSEAAELAAILESARRSNESLGVTGCLAAWNGCFVQILEGSPDAIAVALRRIEADTRHSDIAVRLRREIGTRSFGHWRMAHAEADDAVRAMGDPMTLPVVVLLAELMRIAERSAARNRP
jgi:Sensors of blue-light using FAD